MKQWMRVAVAVVMTLGMFAGCKGKGGDGTATGEGCEVPEVSALDLLQAEIADMKLESGRDAAIDRMKALIADPEQAEYKARVVEWLLDEYLLEDAVTAVQDAYLTLAISDEEVARMGFGKVMQASASTNAAETVAWYEKILASPVSDDMKAYVWQLRARAYSEVGSIAPLADRLSEILALADPQQSLGVLSSAAKLGLSHKDDAGLTTLFGAVKSRCADRDDLMLLALTVDVDLLQQQGALAEVETFLTTHAEALGDDALASRAEALISAAAKAGETPIAERVAAAALLGGAARPRTRDAVALRWLRVAEEGRQPEAFLDRTSAALDAGCPVARVVSAFGNGFYMVMTSKDEALQRRSLELAEKLAVQSDLSESQLQSLTLLRLDGAFYSDDFARAYAIIEGGVPGHDEKWHAEMKDKIGAHLALQEGRPEDAIALFRKHMARVDAWAAPVVNPENGAKMTREAVLGFNEKRIGDIYAGMDGRSADAAAAYARARDWYQKALEDLEPGSIEFKSATAELARVPAAES